MIRILYLFFAFSATNVLSQETLRKQLSGKVTVNVSLIEINVLNVVTGKTTRTNKDGNFFILAKTDDILVFSAINLETFRRTIKPNDFGVSVLLIEMVSKVIELKEIVVNKYPEINAKSLGIIPRNQRTPTSAERRLATAGDFKPIMLLSLLGGSMPLDQLINKINGRTKRLKKLVVLEKKEEYVKLISELYSQEYLTIKLGIPADYVNGFKYFAVENEKFTITLKSNNKTMSTFVIGELANKYKEIIASENK